MFATVTEIKPLLSYFGNSHLNICCFLVTEIPSKSGNKIKEAIYFYHKIFGMKRFKIIDTILMMIIVSKVTTSCSGVHKLPLREGFYLSQNYTSPGRTPYTLDLCVILPSIWPKMYLSFDLREMENIPLYLTQQRRQCMKSCGAGSDVWENASILVKCKFRLRNKTKRRKG